MGHLSRRPCSARHALRLKGGFFRDSPGVGRRGHRAAGALAEARGRHFPPRGSLFYQKAFYRMTSFLAERPPRKQFQLRPREEGALWPPIRVMPRSPCDAVRDVCTSDLPFALSRLSACAIASFCPLPRRTPSPPRSAARSSVPAASLRALLLLGRRHGHHHRQCRPHAIATIAAAATHQTTTTIYDGVERASRALSHAILCVWWRRLPLPSRRRELQGARHLLACHRPRRCHRRDRRARYTACCCIRMRMLCAALHALCPLPSQTVDCCCACAQLLAAGMGTGSTPEWAR